MAMALAGLPLLNCTHLSETAMMVRLERNDDTIALLVSLACTPLSPFHHMTKHSYLNRPSAQLSISPRDSNFPYYDG